MSQRGRRAEATLAPPIADGSCKDNAMIWRVNKPTGGLTRVELRTPGPGRDAIFAEDPWNADTDAFISDNTSGGMDDAPAE